MTDPLTIGAIAAPVAGSLISGLFGNKSQESGLTLPPRYMEELFNATDTNLQTLKDQKKQLDSLIQNYDDRIKYIQSGLEGTIPSKELTQNLAENSAQIALKLGAKTEDLVANGFLDEDDVASLEQLAGLEAEDFRDEEFEREAELRLEQLEQEAQRNNLSDTERELQREFLISDLAVERQQRADIRRQGEFNRGLQLIGTRQALRQGNFQQALQTINAQNIGLEQARQGFLGLQSVNQQQGAFGLQAAQTQQQGALTQSSLFETLGQFKFGGSSGGSSPFNLKGAAIGGAANLAVGSTIGGSAKGIKKVLGGIF